MGRYNGEHCKIEPKEAYLICELAQKDYLEGYTNAPNKDKQIAEQVNLVHRNNRTGKDIRSLLMHVQHCKLTLEDFEE